MSLPQLLNSDDGLTEHYNRGINNNPTPGTIQFNGVTRAGVRVDAGAGLIGTPVKSVWVFYRIYGAPTGNITVNIRKGSDDTVAATIGTYPVNAVVSENPDRSFAVRLRSNSYNMVATDIISVEFPSNATDGFTLLTNTTAGAVTNYPGRQYNGTTWSNSANPPAIVIKS